MLKLLMLLILFTNVIIADTKVEIYASNLETKNEIVEASGGVTVIYKEHILNAKKAKYNQKNGDLELFENINVNYNAKSKILGSYAKLNIAKKEKIFKPLYLLDTKSKIWISADEGNSKQNIFNIKQGTLSGCNPIDPLWTIDFSSSDYDTQSKWINLYNTRVYFYDIPVFYMPYFGYSLDTTRRTGLLKPAFGISDTEGIYYEQPLYIAEQDSWDLELTPQIRTNRGAGIYTNFRFVDSKTSHGNFKMGYFKEQDLYFKEQNLQNANHQGFNFHYTNTNVINQWFEASLQGQSGLYVDTGYMNDVDYINLTSNNSINQSTATQVLSRINMFYNTDTSYYGVYFKYYQDLTIDSNENTLQKLPTLQYHSYLDTLLNNHFLYSLDIKSNNIYRAINKKVIQTDVNIPVSFQTDFFDEFINLAYTANLYGQHSNFNGKEEDKSIGTLYNNGLILKNYHTLSASTQLTKAFQTLTHVVGLEASYTKNGSESKTGFYKDNKQFCSDIVNQNSPECEFFNINDVEEKTELNFTQYLFDLSSKQIFYHRLSQQISHDINKDKYGELENELDYKITDNLSYYNNMFYNFDEKLLSKAINRISYNSASIRLDFSHLYKDSFFKSTLTTPRLTSYLTSHINYIYDKHYSFAGKYNYDNENNIRKGMEIGFLYKKRCWDFGIKYAENNRPVLTTIGKDQSVYDKFIYLSLILKPFMQSRPNSSSFSYKLTGSQQ